MFGIDDASLVGNPEDAYSLQAYLEKWTNDGWVQCLDWMGNPDDNTDKIESDLNGMYQAFITGIPIEEEIVTPVFTPRKPPKKSKKSLEPPTTRASESPGKKDGEDPHFDWV